MPLSDPPNTPSDPPGRRGGRPRRMDEAEIKRDVLWALAQGVPLTVAARRHSMSEDGVRLWAARDPEFAADVASARALGWDALAHQCLEIADDGRNDYMEILDKDGELAGWRYNGENVLRSRLRIETRLKLLRSWDNGRYGDTTTSKVTVDATVTEVRRHVVDPRLLDDEGRAALRSLLAQAAAQGLLEAPTGRPDRMSHPLRRGDTADRELEVAPAPDDYDEGDDEA